MATQASLLEELVASNRRLEESYGISDLVIENGIDFTDHVTTLHEEGAWKQTEEHDAVMNRLDDMEKPLDKLLDQGIAKSIQD
eukprot:35657-Eustigmatos_ZCMA.PRE.1